jgi:hypothetical protein
MQTHSGLRSLAPNSRSENGWANLAIELTALRAAAHSPRGTLMPKAKEGSDMKSKHLPYLYVIFTIISIAVVFGCSLSDTPPNISPQQQTMPVETKPYGSTFNSHSISILVDDFSPQPNRGKSIYFFNRLDGDGGPINNSIIDWGKGQVTTTVSSGNSWGGVWMSLNHALREGLPLNFSSVLPPQILPDFQSQITGLIVQIVRGTPKTTFRIELKDGNNLRWKDETTLTGKQQTLRFNLPALGNINQVAWVLDHAKASDDVVLDKVSFTATTPITDTAKAAFVWSYGMLLNNWNPATGLVRDKAKEVSGEFDAIQATGSLAAATAIAKQLEIVDPADAIQIVQKISDTLLLKIPRKHGKHGLWPHFVMISPAGKFTIAGDTEWSSVDTVIAAIGLLGAQSGLGMDTSGTEQILQAINWGNLVTASGISHGYCMGNLIRDPSGIPVSWDIFGGESWLVELAYAGVTGHVAPITYPMQPTANGSGFIDELAWLYISPPSGQDYWETDWTSYRWAAANKQILYYPTHDPTSCFSQLGLFGLSASEVPSEKDSIYEAFGVGGRTHSAKDGSALLGAPVVVPHYSAMIASLRPQETIKMWEWLINHGYFSPLNNVESLMFSGKSGCDSDSIVWNHLKGSWNLALQTLGWGRYLAERRGLTPVLWQTTTANPLLHAGHSLLSKRPAGK